jgi:hypothetical protein
VYPIRKTATCNINGWVAGEDMMMMNKLREYDGYILLWMGRLKILIATIDP